MPLSMLTDRIRDITERYSRAGYFPSASVRVFDRDKTLAVYTMGDAGEHSLFDVASVSKIATATQILLLLDRDVIHLDGTLAGYFEEIAANDFLRDRIGSVTIRQLLTHTSHIVDWYPFYADRGLDFYAVLEKALRRYPPVEGMVYSDINFMLLGKLLEKVWGMPLERCLSEQLVKPLGFGHMLYKPAADADVIPSCYGNPIETGMCAERGIVFDGFRTPGEPVYGTVNDGNAHYYFDDVAGHAGVFADPEAYENLCRYYMTTDKPVFIEAQHEQPGAPTRGLGLQTGVMYPNGCGHTGFSGTAIYFSRQDNIGCVAFTNRLFYKERNPNMTNDYRRALFEAVYTWAKTCR